MLEKMLINVNDDDDEHLGNREVGHIVAKFVNFGCDANAQCTPTDWQSAVGDIVGRCVPNGDPIVGVNRRYSADSKFESALEPVGASR